MTTKSKNLKEGKFRKVVMMENGRLALSEEKTRRKRRKVV